MIWERWLSCHTQQEIADVLEIPQKTVDDRVKILAEKFSKTKSLKLANYEEPEFIPPLYNMGGDFFSRRMSLI